MKQHDSIASKKVWGISFGYGVAVIATSLSALLRWLLPGVLSPAPYLGFYPAVVVSAALGGVGPGLVSTFVSLFFVDVVFDRFEPFDTSAIIRQTIWVVANIGVSLLAGKMAAARTQAMQEADDLQKSNAFNQSIIDSSIDCIKTLDLEGRLQFMNLPGQRLLEINDLKPYLYVPYADFWKGSDNDRVNEVIRKAKLGQSGSFQGYCPTAKGTPKWWDVSISPVLGANGKPERLLAVSRDITDRKRAEEALAEAHQQIQNIVDNTPAIVYTFDLEERFILANAAIADLLNSTPAQLIGKRRHDFMSQSDADWHEANDRKVIEAGKALEFLEQSELSGRSITWLTTKFPLFDAAGKIYAVGGISTDITDRRNSEKALQENEEQLRTLADSIPNLAWQANGDGYITWYNRRWYEYTGTTREEMEGWGWQSVHDPSTLPRVLEQWQKSIATGRPFEMEFPLRGADGAFRTFLTRSIPIKDSNGNVVRWFGTNTDISTQKEVEEKLRESEERIQQALLVSRSFTFDWQPATDQVRRSASCAAILNLSGDEAVNDTGEHFFQCVHPDDRARLGQVLSDLTPTADSYITEYRYVSKNGSEVTLEETGKASFDASGRMLRLVGVTTDITPRKQAEDGLKKIHAELESRIKERTSDLAKTIDILVEEIHERQIAELNLKRLNHLYAVLSETNQTIVKISDRDALFRDFCRIAVEHGGFILSWIGLVDEQSGKVNIAAASGVTGYLDDIRISLIKEPEGEGPTGISIREGSYSICNDFQNDPCTRPWHDRGKKYGIRASASIAIKEHDRVIGALTLYGGEKDYFDNQQVELLLQMGMDISFALDNLNRENSRKEAEKALYEETLERLKTVETLREKEQILIQQNRQAAMGEMIGNIAHQWRQPLNTLGLYTQMLGTFYGTPDFNKEFLDNSIAKSLEIIKHMSKTIDDFRDFFKPVKGKTDFYVIGAINNTLSLLESNFDNPKISIEIVEHDNPVIKGYQNEFAQVFLNILNNARDAMIEKEIADGRIIITICSEDSCAVVTVADNAGGIPEEIIDKIFDPYFTTKGPQVGTGIGLFMSKTIIEKNMGGRLTVRNSDSGAEFRIEVEHGTQDR